MRILYFAPRDCRPHNSGGKLRNFHLSRELAREAEVTYLAFADDPTPPPHPELAQQIITVPHGGRSPVKLVKGLMGRWPYTILNYTTAEMADRLRVLVKEQSFDVVQVEGLLLAQYLPILKTMRPHPVIACDWHNVDSEVLYRYAEHAPNPAQALYARATGKKLAAIEKEFMPRFDVHLTVSDRDRDHLLQLDPNSKVYTIENGVDAPAFAAFPPLEKPHRIVFVGSMDYHPNVDAVLYFAANAWPRIHQKFPEWTFTVVGRTPPPSITALGTQPGIEVTGTVDDVRPYYAEAIAAVVPLRVGGGSRLKIVEAMAAGVPVVSTVLGAEGLEVVDDKNALLANSPEGLADRLFELASNPERTARLVAAAHDLAWQRYDWSAVGHKLRAIYTGLASSGGQI